MNYISLLTGNQGGYLLWLECYERIIAVVNFYYYSEGYYEQIYKQSARNAQR